VASKPRIGIDARFYGLGSAGLARYTAELLHNLLKVGLRYEFVALVKTEDVHEFKTEFPGVEVLPTRIPHYSLGEQLSLTRQLRGAKLDLMHFTNFNVPLSYRDPFVITLHDLTLFDYSGRSRISRLKVFPMRMVMRHGARASRSVLTISEHQKKLITQAFGTPADKIRVVYEAADARFKPLPPAKVQAFRTRIGLTGPFVMYTGQWRQHKNLVRLLKAFKRISRETKADLVLVGKKDPAFPIIPDTIERLKLGNRVHMTDFVEDADLPYYYNAATLFAFPSLVEGFGLPPLEAMASGTPVVSSNAAPMPEILGDAAEYFNPRSTKAIEESLLKVLGNPALRRKLSQAGAEQASLYSWRKTARQTAQVYSQALR
jgi:glycosyltransferase involved in cell wall biosynthesis